MSESIWLPWNELHALFAENVATSVATFVAPGTPHYDVAHAFALGRLDEGRRVSEWMLGQCTTRPLTVLDIGAGNGGVALGAANRKDLVVHAVDIVPNFVFRALRVASGIPVTQIVGSGHDLPYSDESFDAVFCLETLEHIPNPSALGREIMRVLKTGGICMVMTPARVKYLLRRDPHFGVRGLLLLPDAMQRWLITRVLKRTPAMQYDVEHTFWTLQGMKRIFPGATSADAIFNVSHPHSRLWMRFRNLLWDRVIIRK